MILPYSGPRGEKILNKVIKGIPEKVRPKIVYNGTKLARYFSVKDKIKIEYLSDIIYRYKSSKEDQVDYTGETKCRFGKRIKEHQGADKNSAIVTHFKTKNLSPPEPNEFTILARNYPNRLKRRIAESLYIKHNKSVLNIQKDSHKLELFN